MKRAVMFDASCIDSIKDFNQWLQKFPEAELVDVKPMADSFSRKIIGILNIPDNLDTSKFSDRFLDYMGLEKKEGGAE